MRINHLIVPGAILFFLFLWNNQTAAIYSVSPKGQWPESWPKQLDRLREDATTMEHTNHRLYIIPFSERETFEAMWPHLLKAKSPSGHLILRKNDGGAFGLDGKVGVRILAPPGDCEVTSGVITTRRKIEKDSEPKHWTIKRVAPYRIQLKTDQLPERVTFHEGRWVPLVNNDPIALFQSMRVRTDIELIVDGDIIDLNRIPLPKDTPIIDRRFENQENNRPEK